MTLLDFNKIVEGKKFLGEETQSLKTLSVEDLETFRQYLSIEDSMVSALASTDNAAEFYSAYPILKSLPYDSETRTELFYAAKLGKIYTDIPCRLVYLVSMALRKTPSPNRAFAVLKETNALYKYLAPGAIKNNITIKQIVEDILKKEIKTVTAARRKVKYQDFYEIYVENIDNVVLVPEGIAECIDSHNDLKAVNYVEEKGVCVYDTPIRTLGGYFGITKNEFDLREVR
jgi:hypothetical protein